MNTISQIVSFDTCVTETELEITNIVPRTQPIISGAFIENVRDRGTDVDVDVLRTRITDLLKQGEYSQGEIYAKVHSRASSAQSFKSVAGLIQDMLDGGTIMIVECETARKYTFAQISSSALQEIRDREVQDIKAWIPQRWRKESPTTRGWSIRCR